MTPIVEATAPANALSYQMLNPIWVNSVSTVLTMLKDRSTFIGCSNTVLQQSTNLGTTVASGTPTWTTIYTFPTAVTGFTELPNGEALVTCAGSGTVSHIYVSTGWSTSKTTATWTDVLQTIGGGITPTYCIHDWSNAADGTVLISESGAQTTGGSGNVAADVAKARRVWLSKDFGRTWSQIFDIVDYAASRGTPYAAGVHIHGVSYDQEWQRIWICFGDNTGDGKVFTNTGYVQVCYSDDGGATWVLMVTPPYWDNKSQYAKTLQFIVAIPFNNSLVFTTDATEPYAAVVYPKTGFRQLGEPHCGPMYDTAVNGLVRKAVKDARFPTFFTGLGTTSGTAGVNWPIPITDDDGFSWSSFRVVLPVQTPGLTQKGFNQILGPTLDGKVVGVGRSPTDGMYANGDNTKRMMIADLVYM